MRRRAYPLGVVLVLFGLALWGRPQPALGQAVASPANPAAIVPMLQAFDRVIQVLDLRNASPRDAFGELGRIGGIRISLDASVPTDLTLSVTLKGVRLGDALSMVCQPSGLRLLPGNGTLVVAAAPRVAVSAGGQNGRPAAVTLHNPWSGWAEMTGLPLVPGGETGYPRLATANAGPVAPGATFNPTSPVCARCRQAVLAHWVFCPRCGQRRLEQAPVGKFCWECGRAHEAEKPAPSLPARPPRRK